jgi:hypothetical protein
MDAPRLLIPKLDVGGVHAQQRLRLEAEDRR